mgnify:CR=1 FL=1
MIKLEAKEVMFKWEDLHKQVGVITVTEPTESDIAEGMFHRVVYFINEKREMYLIHSEDIRND